MCCSGRQIEDGESSDALAKAFKKRGIVMMTGAKIEKAAPKGAGISLSVENAAKKETLDVECVRAPLQGDATACGTLVADAMLQRARDGRLG